jgi:hypothetical protein
MLNPGFSIGMLNPGFSPTHPWAESTRGVDSAQGGGVPRGVPLRVPHGKWGSVESSLHFEFHMEMVVEMMTDAEGKYCC